MSRSGAHAAPRRVALSLLAALAFPACFTAPDAAAEDAARPNIVLLVTDDQRRDALGAYGNPVIHTPQLDRLAAEGVTFDDAFVTSAVCTASRASLLTGQYAARHGVWRFDRALTPAQLAQTYPAALAAAGYRTGFIGKWGVGKPPQGLFDYDRAFGGQGQYWIERGGRRRHQTAVLGEQAAEFLAGTKRGEPFLLSISFKAPHADDGVVDPHGEPFPFEPELGELYADATIPVPELAAPRYFEQLPIALQDSEARARWAVLFWGPARYQSTVKSYYRLISGVDAVVGRIREQLASIGADRDTVIVFTSDNGFYLGEYGLAGKWFPHDVSIRVPLIVFDPRLPAARRGARRDAAVLNVDVAPTLLELAGVAIPAAMQGRSLLPLVRGESPAWREAWLYEHLLDHPGLPKSEAVRTARWKYVRYLDLQPVREELYDLAADPGETRDLAADPGHRTILEGMRRRRDELRAEAK